MVRIATLLWALLSLSIVKALPRKTLGRRAVQFAFGKDQVRGLNAGGWLLLEPWITPSIFQAQKGPIDEYTLTQQLGHDAALAVLKPHWDTFITFEDFQKAAQSGFNTIRIPIGYWAYQTLPQDPYVQGAADYIDAAIDWARALGLKIWIDLHGAPGSQNGLDNSGRKGGIYWEEDQFVKLTLSVLNQISQKYAQPDYQDVVVAIELLNEPMGPTLDDVKLKQFYYDGFGQVRAVSDTAVVLHDAFLSPAYWNGILTPQDSNAQNVLMDHHEYQIFELDNIRWSNTEHAQKACSLVDTYRVSDKWVVVGEWTGAMTDCASALNGYGIGARYDGTYPGSSYVGSCATINFLEQWSQQLKDHTRRYIEAQLDTFEQKTNGWIFWTMKTEGSPEWDAFRLIDAGIFPQPLNDRKFPPVCG
ncbi:MAG: exo-1,3-beta-glucanase [Vezdaea acicularis]|nr:MAG: exo-1,3-beta-glucanase [Vezdaea acicularis]